MEAASRAARQPLAGLPGRQRRGGLDPRRRAVRNRRSAEREAAQAQAVRVAEAEAAGRSVNRLRDQRLYLAEVNADHWKTWVHQRLSTPLGQPGAMTLFQTQPKEHLSFA